MQPDLETATPGPGAGTFSAFLRAVSRRKRVADALVAVAAGGLAGALVTGGLLWRGRGFALMVAASAAGVMAAATWWTRRHAHTSAAAAVLAERAHPQLRNVLITAEELSTHPDRASAWIRDRVTREASALTAALRPSDLVPIAWPAATAIAVGVIWSAVLLGLPGKALEIARETLTQTAREAPPRASVPGRITAQLRPPVYTRLPDRELTNPDRLDAVAGTALRLRISGGEGWRVRFGSRPLRSTRDATGLVVETVLTESGYLAVEPDGGPADAAVPAARSALVPVSVTPDQAPVVRIAAPARDLLLPHPAANLPVTAAATDDFALHALELRYTKVSGTGEQFEFEEGRLPLRIARSTDRAWTGRADLPLGELKLQPGDTLVYRAVGRDRRPGEAGLSSSDAFFIEIQGPGQVALEGIEMPPDQERYALSQQMVVLKIERLRASERTMPAASLQEQTAAIAAEQRAVRANFIFLMGGHVEDEFEEAEHSNEIQEGRLENTARKDISLAIHQMTLAEQGLTAMSTSRALPAAKAAVEALQRAFGRNRYILRTTASRSRIDPSRRLTGSIAGASSWSRDPGAADVNSPAAAARRLLTDLLDVAATVRAGQTVPRDRISGMAERALATEPGSAEWQTIAAKLIALGDAAARGTAGADLMAALNDATAPLITAAHRGARPSIPPSSPAGPLHSAWATEVRK